MIQFDERIFFRWVETTNQMAIECHLTLLIIHEQQMVKQHLLVSFFLGGGWHWGVIIMDVGYYTLPSTIRDHDFPTVGRQI